jgi:nucleoside-diphosphate-sugar epimerase
MNILFTGASSPLGGRVLRAVLAGEDTNVWAGVHHNPVSLEHPRLKRFDLSLDQAINLEQVPTPLGKVIHFAGITHTSDTQTYWRVNYEGTVKLAEAAQKHGCSNFVFVSTRCATPTSGPYGESKLAAENKLRAMNFESLLILRPSEIYGASGTEGVDRMLRLASKLRVALVLWGDKRLQFAPLHIDDFVRQATQLINGHGSGERIVELCGPESMNAATLGLRIARAFHALPLPLWWPGLVLLHRLAELIGVDLFKADQIQRAVGEKTSTRSTAGDAQMKFFLKD